MIRPFTLLCFCAFAGAGAWLYQVKHSVALKDRELQEVRRETEQARQRIDILRAEWALLNEPERLRQTATRILTLEPMQPQHFARATEFERRLPMAVAFAGPPSLLAPEPPAAARPAEPVAVAVAAAQHAPVRAAAAPEPRAVEAPAPRALVAVVAAQRAEQAARPALQPVRAAPAPIPAPIAMAAAAPPPRAVRPVQAAPAPQPTVAVTRVAQTNVAPTAVASALGSASSLGRPMLAPPVPISSAAAATLHGRGMATQ